MIATRILLGLAAGLACTLPGAAADIRGRITRVDVAKNKVVVEGLGRFRGATLTLTLDPKTRVQFGATAATPEDLVSGRRARVTYDETGGRMVARVIRVRGPRPERATPAAGAVSGKLLRVALTDREVVVMAGGPKGETETTVAVPEKVRITRGGKALTLDDLKEGEVVTVRTEKRGGRLTAVSIQVGTAAAAMSDRAERIQRVRRVLKLIDAVLEQASR